MRREEHCKQISLACVGSAHSVLATMGLSPLTACSFMVYTAQAPRCSAGELCKLGPWLHALPRSKLLRIRFSGTPQRRRLCWACVLCRSQVRAAQATRCLVSTLSPGGAVCLITSPVPDAQFPGCSVEVLSQVCCGEGGTLQTNITGMCGECSQCLGHTGFAPTHGVLLS